MPLAHLSDCRDSEVIHARVQAHGANRERLRFPQMRQDTCRVTQRKQRIAQGQPEIKGLLAPVARLWQMRQGTERLLEARYGLAMGRPCHGLLSRLPAIDQRLSPHFTPEGMMRQAFDLFN